MPDRLRSEVCVELRGRSSNFSDAYWMEQLIHIFDVQYKPSWLSQLISRLEW